MSDSKKTGFFPTPRAGKTTNEKEETWLRRQKAGSVATPPLALAITMGEIPKPKTNQQEFYLQLAGPVKISALPGSKQESSTVNAQVYGQKLPVLLATCLKTDTHQSASLKTSVHYSAEAIWLTPQVDLFTEHGSEEFSETWPKSGMTVNGTAYALESLTELSVQAHRTEGSGSGLLPTPNTMDTLPSRSFDAMKRQATNGARKNRKYPGNLRERIDPEMCRAYEEASEEANQGAQETVQMWPTPDASQRGPRKADLVVNRSTVERRGSGQKRGMDLQTAAKMLPTPTKSDYKGSGPTVIRKDGKDRTNDRLDYATEQVNPGSGQLNPAWVCWLMGLPLDYLDLDGYQNPELEGLPPEYLTECKN